MKDIGSTVDTTYKNEPLKGTHWQVRGRHGIDGQLQLCNRVFFLLLFQVHQRYEADL